MPGFDPIINSKLNRLLEGGGYTENKTLTYDGDGGGKDISVDGNMYTKIHDEFVDINALSELVVQINGRDIVLDKELYTVGQVEDTDNYWVITLNDGAVIAFQNPFPEDGLDIGVYVLSDPDLQLKRMTFETIVPIKPDYLPKGGVGYTDSYDIQWDGNTEGKVTIPLFDNVYFVKVSNRILTKAELVGASYVFSDETFVITEQDIIDNSAMGVTTQFYGVIGGVFDDDLPMIVSCEACTVNFEGNPVVVPSDGTYFLDALALGLHAHVYSLSGETIHKIDQKYLPGVCVPMVELSTTFKPGNQCTDEENKILTAAFEKNVPVVIKCAADLGEYGVFKNTALVWCPVTTNDGIATMFIASFCGITLQIFDAYCAGVWGFNFE